MYRYFLILLNLVPIGYMIYLYYENAFMMYHGELIFVGMGWIETLAVLVVASYAILNLLFVFFTIKENETNLLNLWLKVRLKKSEQLRETLEKELED